ncbi:hypothetical protein HDU93_005229 [Gonapodya sp. JEL0774]|nr:hypothetical protein HDU93_005229 [Gonapodya sp. JEL0774]
MPMLSLPPELLSHVFTFCHPASFLASVPLVSRQWRRLALDFLGPTGVLIDVHLVLKAVDVHETSHAWQLPTSYDVTHILHEKFRLLHDCDVGGSTGRATVAGSVVAQPSQHFTSNSVHQVLSSVLSSLIGYRVLPRVQSVDISPSYNPTTIRCVLFVMREHVSLTMHQIRSLHRTYQSGAEQLQETDHDGLREAAATIRGVYVKPYHSLSTLSEELVTLLEVFPNLRRLHFSVAGLRRSLPHPADSLSPSMLTQASQLSVFLAPYNRSGGVTPPDLLLTFLEGDFALFPNLNRLGMFRPLDDAWVFLSQRAHELPVYPREDITLVLQLDASSLPSLADVPVGDQLTGFNQCLQLLFPHGIRCVELHVYRDGRSPRGEQTELNVWCDVAASIPAKCIEVHTDGVRFGEGQEAAWSMKVVAAIRAVANETGKGFVKGDVGPRKQSRS